MGIAYGKGWGSGSTSEAGMFIRVAGITDNVQKDAIKSLVNFLKGEGLWDKLTVVYPIVGGTESSHRLNLKDVSKHRISFSPTQHSADGFVMGTGSHDLHLSLSEVTTNTQTSFCAVLRVKNNVANMAVDWGTYPDDGHKRVGGHIRYTDNKVYYDHGTYQTTGRVSVVNTSTAGTYIFTRKEDVQSITVNGSISSFPGKTSIPQGGALRLNTNLQDIGTNARVISFVAFGEGLTPTEITALNNVIDNFQSKLNR